MAAEMLNPLLRLVRSDGRGAERRLLERAGSLLASAGIGQDTFAQPNARIPHAAGVALIRIVVDVLEDPAAALHAGAAAQPDDFGLFEYVVRSAATLGLSSHCSQRY